MKKSFSLLLLSLLCWVAQAQSPVVPNNIYFADMHLQVTESARADIQKLVNALTQHPAYFQKKVELADAYFPFIEKAFQEEGVPTDFKYLVLQESGLVSDAVSKSNAVGFWQFKEGSATDVGIKVNSMVDERKHIIESSRGAAKYMLRNNVYYKNWFNTLLSYYQGLTGTKALTKTSDIGVKKIEVNSQTNKYLLTFLAHKVAFENAVGKNPNPTITLQPVKAIPGQTLTEIAMAAQADAAEVERYNKWLMASRVPSDKEYTVMIPYTAGAPGAPRPVLAQAGPVRKQEAPARSTQQQKPKDSVDRIKGFFATLVDKINGVHDPKSIVAQPGDTKDMLALQGNISTAKFLRVNDMRTFDEIEPGKTYYLEAKRGKAKDTEYHVTQRGEDLHDIAQKYGVKMNKLLAKNRMKQNESLVPGRVVWLKETRPTTIPVEVRPLDEEEEAAPAPKEVIAQKTAPTANPAPTTQATAAPTAAAPIASAPKKQAAPKAGAISVEVEDTTAAPYVRKAKQEEAAEAALATASSQAQYPAKKAGGVAKPAPPIERKAPDEPVVAEVRTPATQTQPASVLVSDKHVVEKGETLYSISKKYEVSMEDLLAWNNLDGSAPLSVGKELSLIGPAATANPTSSTATATLAKAAPASVATSASATEHTVVAGETLYAISRKYSVSLQDLQTWNDLSTGSISVGQKLLVAAPKESQTEAAAAPATATGATVTHKVAAGESMYAISRKYGVSIKEIMEWNNKPDFNVSVGESLMIKPKQ